MRERFIDKNFSQSTLRVIEQADMIINEYAAQGYSLTLRQLYYQFVARGLIENTMRSYKRIGSIVNDARLAGYLDWEAIEDRTRNLEGNPHFDGPAHAMDTVYQVYRTDLWASQLDRVEVWIEKEALVGVIADVCEELDVPYFACRGYVSQSEVWRAYHRSIATEQGLIILHFGDHDPSGIDMTRDNLDRLRDVFGGNVVVERMALNLDQVNEYSPPPNPAKMTDSRFTSYSDQYGDQSWELDALEPSVINSLIQKGVSEYRDDEAWAVAVDEQEYGRGVIRRAIEQARHDDG